MTGEQPEPVQPEQPATGIIQWVDLGAVSFGVPGVPYSKWPMAKDSDFIAEFMKAKEWADAYREVFESYAADQSEAAATVTAYQKPQGRRVNPNPTLASQVAPARQGGAQKASGLLCAQHTGVALVLSKAEYQVYDDVDGQQVPAKFFCPGDKNGTGTNHSVWRSKAIAAGGEASIEPDERPF